MPRLGRLPELQRKTLLSYPAQLNDSAPFTRPARPLNQSRLALVTTAGLHVRTDRPFAPGDKTYRAIPESTPKRDILLSHSSIGFDRAGILQDLNVVFPVDRLRELAEQGEIGSLGPTNYSFMGAQYPPLDELINDSIPGVAERLKEEGVQVILLTGA